MTTSEKYFEKLGLSKDDFEKIISVFYKFHNLEKVILYGSRAKGNFKIYSDIDLTLVGKDLNLKKLHLIEIALDDLFLPYKFDLSIKNHIQNQDLLDHIERVGIEIFSKK